jgi:hypothetical protein
MATYEPYPTRPTLAKKITVDLHAKRLYVDGVEFPWHVSADDIEITGLGPDSMPTVRLSILAETVEVIPKLSPGGAVPSGGTVHIGENGEPESIIPKDAL